MLLLEEGPCPLLYVLGGQIYMEVLIGYKPRSPTRVLSGSFLMYPTSFTTV
jgi:hypothetical protein